MQKLHTRNMTRIALLSVLAGILHLRMFRFPLPFMPPIMDYDLSGIPEMVSAFTMGPGAGVITVILKNMVKMVMEGPSPAVTGEIQNIILSSVYLLTATYIFQLGKKSRNFALIGMIVGAFATAAVAVFTNMYFIIPFYSMAMGFTMESVIEMTRMVNPFVTGPATFIALGIVPFNLIKGSLTALFGYLTYPMLMRIAGGDGKHAVQ